MKRVLVTGGSGFVGANLVRRLLCDGHDVHLLLRPGYQTWRLIGLLDQIRVHEIQLHDAESVARTVKEIRPEWIFHLAANGAYSWQTDLNQMVQTNVQGTMALVTACLHTGFEAFVNAGSSSEYGYKSTPPPEREFLEPNSHYAVTKASATLFCRYMSQRERVPITTLRLYSVFGAYEDPKRFIPALIVNGLKRRYPPLVSPETARDYVYIDDVVNAFILAASKHNDIGEVYNIGTGIQTSIADAVAIAKQIFNIKEDPIWGSMPNRTWDTHIWVADNTCAVNRLGWHPKTCFTDGFKKTVEWFQHVQTVQAMKGIDGQLTTTPS